MKVINFSTRRPVSVFIFAVAAVVFGMVAFQQLATDLLPDITYPSLSVRTVYEGTAPIEVESLITRPIENAVGVVNNVVRVTSSSRLDTSEVTLEFAWGTNMDIAALEVRERLDVLRLPVGADRPLLLRYDPSLDPIVRIGLAGGSSSNGNSSNGSSDGVTSTSAASDLIHLRLIAEEQIKRSLERIEGVAAAVVSGGLEEEIQIEIDEKRLANLGWTVDRLINRLNQENVNLTGGRLRDGQTEFLVRTVGEFVRPRELNDVVLASENGALIKMRDVARIVRGYKEREIITRIDGRESVEVAIYKEGGTNTVTVSDEVQKGLDALRENLVQVDPSLQLVVITDQARYIRQSVQEVLETAAWGGSLAILVLFFFLRSWKTTSIIGIAIPISVIATFFLMYVADISLNIISLGGLTLGIGLLVDNAIVVLEAIQRKRDEGLGDVEAADAGASEVARAVTASTLTTICVFVPIVYVEGIAGQLFGDQAMTVAFSLVVSLIVALSVIPMLASRRFDFADKFAEAEAAGDGAAGDDAAGDEAAGDEEGTRQRFAPIRWLGNFFYYIFLGIGRLFKYLAKGIGLVLAAIMWLPLKVFGFVFDHLPNLYGKVLDAVLRQPVLTVLATLLLFFGSLQLFPRLGQELVPEMIQGEFFVNVELPPGTQLDVTQRRLASLEGFSSELPGVRTVYALAGTSNEQGGVAGDLREHIGQMTVMVDGATSREYEEGLMAEIRGALDRQDNLEYRFGRPSYFSFRTPIEVEIRGYNLNLLKRLAEDLVRRMEQIEGLRDVKSSTEGGNPELQIFFDRERLAALDLSLNDVASVVRTKVQGTVATDIQREDRTIDIRLRSAEEDRDSVRDLLKLNVHQNGSTALPLSAVAEVLEIEGPAEIRRADGDRVAVITANLAGRDLASVTADIEAILEGMTLPKGFNWRIGGQRQEMETSFNSMRMAIGLAIFMVYLVMASQFESLLHPMVILFSVPFSLIGVLATLYVFDVTISIVVLIGVILLAGIVVNNAIILVDYTNQLRRAGMAKVEALQKAGRVRLRPILMTTSTTVLGLLPMAIGLGEGAELRTPMALAVIGGLLVSTLLTLLIIPAVYSVFDRGR